VTMQGTIRPGYKQTEVGVIPEDWDCINFSDFIAIQRGHDLTARQRRPGNVPVMGSAGQNGFHDTALTNGPGIVIGRSGASFGQAHWCDADYWPHNTALYVTDFLGNDPKFVFHFLRAMDFSQYNSGGAQQSLNRNFIASIKIPVASPEEQRAIAEALSDADGLIGALEALIAKKRDLKQAVMQQLLTGKTRLPGFSGAWEVKRLGELLEYEQPTKYLVSSTDYDDSYDIPVLTAGKSFLLGRTNEDEGVFAQLPVIIFDDFTTATQFVDFPFKAKSSAMKLLKPRSLHVNLRLVYDMMQTIDFVMSDHKRYWISEYQNIEVPFPGSTEQTAIAEALSDMDADLAALEAQRDKAKEIKQGMMQELLTGKVRLV